MSLKKGVSKFMKDGEGLRLEITKVNTDGTLNIDAIQVEGTRYQYGENLEQEWFRENTVDRLEKKKKI